MLLHTLVVFAGVTFGGEARPCVARTIVGTAVGVYGRYLGLESEAAATIGLAPIEVVTTMANVVIRGPLEQRVQPFGLFGIGLMVEATTLVTRADVAWGIGGGVQVRLREHLALRSDVRYVRGSIGFGRLTTGLVVQ